MTCRRWTQALVALSLVTGAAVVVPGAAHAALPAPLITPCEQSIAYPEGDAMLLGPPPFGQGVYEPDLDITRSDVRVTATEVIDTITVAGLDDRPVGATGDYFYLFMQLKLDTAQFGYVREATGGYPYSFDDGNDVNAVPPKTSSAAVAPFYDKAHNQVTLRIPRAAVAAAFGVPQRDLLLTTNSSSEGLTAGRNVLNGGERYLPVTNHAQVPLNFEDCDNYLATHPDPAPAVGPCLLSFDAPVGDEAVQGMPPAAITDDDSDITHVSVLADASTVTVTEQVARLAATPLVGTGHRFGLAVSSGGRTAHIGAGSEGAVVTPYATKADGTAGSTSLTAEFDTALSQVRLKIPRTDWDALFGGPGAAGTVDHLTGESSVTTGGQAPRDSDLGAVAPGDGRFSVADCDAAVSSTPDPGPTTPAPAPTTPAPGNPAPTSPAPTNPSPTSSPAPGGGSGGGSSGGGGGGTVQPAGSPPVITSVRPSGGALTIAFTRVASATGYTATCALAKGGATRTATGSRSPLTITGLQARQPYTCTVRARTGNGQGPLSNSQTGRPGAIPKVTLTAPANAAPGSRITLTGTATASGTPVTHRTVTITYRRDGTSTRNTVGKATTDTKGRYTLTLTIPGPGAYQAAALIEGTTTRNKETYVHRATTRRGTGSSRAA